MLKEMANLLVSALFHQTVEALPLAPGPCIGSVYWILKIFGVCSLNLAYDDTD